jgi:esterase/lipase
MAQRKPDDKSKMEQVLKLVAQLSPDELVELYRRLNAKSWGIEWKALCREVADQSKNLPPISEEEVADEMRSIKEELKAERAQYGN